MSDTDTVHIEGMNPSVYTLVSLVVLLGIYLEVVPNNLVTGFGVTMVLGGALAWIGKSIPGLRMFGGGPLLCIFMPALLVHGNLFPASGVDIIQSFFGTFIDFMVAALIVGSVLSMNGEMLAKVGVRLIVPVLGAITLTFLIGGGIGHVTGFGFRDAILYVVAPIMGGGIGAGAIPMSEIYASAAGGDAADYISLLVPAIIIANVFCIVVAGGLNGLGKRDNPLFSRLSGHGHILRLDRNVLSETGHVKLDTPSSATFASIGTGIVVSAGLYILGHVIASVVPTIHAYAWMILATGMIRVLNWVPASIETASGAWYGFVTRTWIPAILVAVSITLIQIDPIVQILMNPIYVGIAVTTVFSAALGAGMLSVLVSMYFIEGSIVGGLCMADVGGSGDVAVLGASERMHLIPFAQICSRLGGALMLVVMSILVPFLSSA